MIVPGMHTALQSALLARVHDAPETVEIRGLLLDADTEVRGEASGAVLVSAAYSLLALVGEPSPSLVARAIVDVGDGDGWAVLALRALPLAGLDWSRAAMMTLTDEARLTRAVDASRGVVDALTRQELTRVPESHAAELTAAFARGPVMCARIDGELASFAHAALRTESYFDVSVHTLGAYRDRGLAQLAAAALIRAEQSAGRMPVWGAMDDNAPSIAVGRALGFTAVGELFVVEL